MGKGRTRSRRRLAGRRRVRYKSAQSGRRRHGSPAWKLIIFYRGKRSERLINDWRQGLEISKGLNERGIKAHLVSRRRAFPPKGEASDPDQMWCPYCRRWRYFTIPKYTRNAAVETEEGWMNVFHDQGLAVCQWCHISEAMKPVADANELWFDLRRKKRRRKNRRRV